MLITGKVNLQPREKQRKERRRKALSRHTQISLTGKPEREGVGERERGSEGERERERELRYIAEGKQEKGRKGNLVKYR